LAASVGTAFAQDLNPKFKKLIDEQPLRAGGNTCPYDLMYSPQTYSAVPSGYTPFYISHYGRHGSRSNWDLPLYEKMLSILSKADSAGVLTPDGKFLKETVEKEIFYHDEMAGRLTKRGIQEHKDIARRMFGSYGDVLTGGSGKIRAISSTVPRCIISMVAFTDQLTELHPALDISWDTGEKYMRYIDSGSTKEVMQESSKIIDSLMMGKHVCDSLFYAKELFTDEKAAFSMVPSWKKFEEGMYAVARITGSFEIPGAFHLMPSEAIYHFSARDNMWIYMNQCNSAEFGDIRMPRSKASVEDIVKKADKVISGQDDIRADLRFGHDFPFLGMTSYMGIEGVGQRLRAEEICDKWFAALYTPFATNLQIIFYRSESGPILVKFLLDERETGIEGLTPYQGVYYRWDDVKGKWGMQ